MRIVYEIFLFTFLITNTCICGCKQQIESGNEDIYFPDPPYEFPKDEYKTNPGLDGIWGRLDAVILPDQNLTGDTSRGIAEFLLEAAASNWPQERLRKTLQIINYTQITDTTHRYYGNFLWRLNDPVPVTSSQLSSFDENGVKFVGAMLTMLRLCYYDKLNDENKALLDKMIDPLMVSIKRDIASGRTDSTNIWALRVWIMCGLGEALGNEEILCLGKDALREWVQAIRDHGITEFNSGIYGQVTGRALGATANLIKDPEIKCEAGILLKYFSRLTAGNLISYDDENFILGGAQSRNYNFVNSKGGEDCLLFYQLLTGKETEFFNNHAAWKLSGEDMALFRQKNRLLMYRYNMHVDSFAIHYVGSNFSMGSARQPYNNHDKAFVVNFFDVKRPAVVHIASYISGREDPYGERLVSGHPFHYRYPMTARAHRVIPSGSEMVILQSTNSASESNIDRDTVNHYTILPADRHDGMWDGNIRVHLKQNEIRKLSTDDNTTVFIRFGDAAAGIRYLAVRDSSNNDLLPEVRMVNIPNLPAISNAGTAMHLQAQLSSAKLTSTQYAVAAVWWRVKEGITTDEQFAAFRNEMINAQVTFSGPVSNVYTVLVKTPDGDLGVSGNRSTRLQTDNIGGLNFPQTANFTVNGVELAPVLFTGSAYFNE